jgi:hypothetical protein
MKREDKKTVLGSRFSVLGYSGKWTPGKAEKLIADSLT